MSTAARQRFNFRIRPSAHAAVNVSLTAELSGSRLQDFPARQSAALSWIIENLRDTTFAPKRSDGAMHPRRFIGKFPTGAGIQE
jgi:hypothetical protein